MCVWSDPLSKSVPIWQGYIPSGSATQSKKVYIRPEISQVIFEGLPLPSLNLDGTSAFGGGNRELQRTKRVATLKSSIIYGWIFALAAVLILLLVYLSL
jgi:hypothetical protein